MVENVEYKLDINLYELITFSEIEVKSSEVLIGLRKKTRGLWPRLLQRKCNVRYLGVMGDINVIKLR